MPYDELRKGRHSDPWRIYFITTVLEKREKSWFADFFCARYVVAEMRALHDGGVVTSQAWVVMPDHVHWLFQLGDTLTLPAVVKQFKACSALRINRHLNRQGPFWQKAYYDHAIRKEEDLRQIARYIVANPLRAGLVKNIGDYPHWDAIWL